MENENQSKEESCSRLASNDLLDRPPNPGSPEAIEKGCVCPIPDNNHGKGFYIVGRDEPVFWYQLDCPLHEAV